MKNSIRSCPFSRIFNFFNYHIAIGFTKHYTREECHASAIGNGGLEDIGSVNGTGLADKLRERDTLLRRVMESYPFENTL